MDPIKEYIAAGDEQVRINMGDKGLQASADLFFKEIVRSNWVRGFTWMGVPILQLPTDLMVMQEIIWKVQPDYIIETGVAFGGMSRFYSSILERQGDGYGIYCIDIDIRQHTRDALKHASFVHLIEDSSINPAIAEMLKSRFAEWRDPPNVLVSLDSNHTHDHVLAELRLYSPLVSVGSYIVVFDTMAGEWGEKEIRPWGPGNNGGSAVRQFLKETDDFVVDKEIEQRAWLTAAPGGWLRRVK